MAFLFSCSLRSLVRYQVEREMRNYIFLSTRTHALTELLRAKGARALPHTLENLVTHRSQKIFSCHVTVLTSVRQNKKREHLYHITTLILEIPVMIY